MSHLNGIRNKNEELYYQKIYSNQDEKMFAYGYEKDKIKKIITIICYMLTFGLLRLFFHWYPYYHLRSTYKKCPLNKATKILIIDDYQGKHKSYIVKDIEIISTKNLSKKTLKKFDAKKLDKNLINGIKENKLFEINLENGCNYFKNEYKSFWCKKQCYIWDEKTNEFSKLLCNNLNKFLITSNDDIQGLSKEEQFLRRIMFGNNEIIIPVQSFLILFILELLNPFYIFQLFSLFVWYLEQYYYYAMAVVLMAAFGIISSIRQTRSNQISLRDTVASTDMVKVLRDTGEYEYISSVELVPGDIIELSKDKQITCTCDAILLNGICIVNESMLTGESLPVTKTPIQSNTMVIDSKELVHHTLFSGTTIIQVKQFGDEAALAKVIKTGLFTNKGSLISAILYPPPTDFKFDRDTYKLIAILIAVGIFGFFYTLIAMILRGSSVLNIVIKTLTVFTIVVPPALPSVMAVGKLYALYRLKNRNIYCINSKAINISGSIDCVCFDKTGTLTEDGLDMMGVMINDNNHLNDIEKDINKLRNHKIFEGMLTCHSLNLMDEQLVGDPLDIKMFEYTNWLLTDPEYDNNYNYDNRKHNFRIVKSINNNESSIKILQQYQFSSTLQRMSVITQNNNSDKLISYTKGSPEMVINLSKPMTVPNDTMIKLKKFTKKGYRVIAFGSKEVILDDIEVTKISRDEIEKDLDFLGFIILENRLKETTVGVIKELTDANIRTIMITGDNIETATSVARECGILADDQSVITVKLDGDKDVNNKLIFRKESVCKKDTFETSSLVKIEEGQYSNKYKFVINGDTWEYLNENQPDIIPALCVKGAVFARMSSDQKQQLVVQLIQLGYFVAMCGDGANDCGALRAAHVGISLSEAESSVASPFTSLIPNVTCVPTVIKEGRAALVTSFGIFKFTVAYSLIQFISTMILYSISSNFSGLQFLYVDIFLFVNFAFFFGKTEAYVGKLVKEPPASSLVSFIPLFSLGIHVLIMTVFNILTFSIVREFYWFEEFQPVEEYFYLSYENYSVFCISIFQYTIVAIIFSKGKPYRQPMYTNKGFLFSVTAFTLLNAYITVYPNDWIIKLLELKVPPESDWGFLILGLALINFIVCFIFESFVVEYIIQNKMKRQFYQCNNSKKLYLNLEENFNIKTKLSLINNEFNKFIEVNEFDSKN